MHTTLWSLAPLALLLTGCNKDKDDTGGGDDTADTGDTSDTGDTTDTGDTSSDCTAAVTSTDPTAGATDVYYRGIYTISFDQDGSAADISVLDGAGAEVATDVSWSEGNVQAELRADLAASTPYTLHIELCGVTTDVPFTTSALGTPLTDGNESLIGKTYMIQLSEADITDPALLDAIASQYLTVPLLFQVTASDATSVDLLGALGEQNTDGTYSQLAGLPTWDFPAGDFSDSPYFSAAAEYITIMYGDIPIPIEGFTLEGSFTSDGSQIQMGRATGKADSRFMAPLISRPEDDYGAFCELAGAMGIPCEPCADGKPYCLYIVAENITALYQPGVTLEVYK